MTEANKFLDKKGYDELKLHEMVVVPKIQMQSIMQEYADEQLHLHIVSNRRELLIDFSEKYWNINEPNPITKEFIDDYLQGN